MQRHPVVPASLQRVPSISPAPATCSKKFRTENVHYVKRLKLSIRSSKQSSEPSPMRVEKVSKKDLSRILRTEAAIRGVERKTNSKKHNSLWPKAVLEALDEAIVENRWEAALKIFELLRKQHWYEPRTRTYTKLLVMLGKCKQPEQAGFLFELMLSEGIKPTIDVYTTLLGAYGKSGLLNKAFSIFDDMKSVSECKPDVYTYTVLLNCCCKFGHFDMIKRILDEMSYLGIQCNSVTYNTIIDGYGKAKMFEEMERLLGDMIMNGDSVPDIVTFNSVIGAYGNSGHIKEMEKWYDEFRLMELKPDDKTFNILIRSYGKAGMYEKMRSVMEFMEKRFFSPTIVTNNIIIEAFGRAGNIEKMDEYFKKMKHEGMKPNSITYCSLVSAYSKAGLTMKIESILRHVENSDVVLDTPFFNCIINAYGQAGDLDKMCELFLAMKEKKCKPDKITYTTMIQAYNSNHMAEAAKVLENEMVTAEEDSGIIYRNKRINTMPKKLPKYLEN